MSTPLIKAFLNVVFFIICTKLIALSESTVKNYFFPSIHFFSLLSVHITLDVRFLCANQWRKKMLHNFLFKHQKIKTILHVICVGVKKSYQAYYGPHKIFPPRLGMHAFGSLFLWGFLSANFRSYTKRERAASGRHEYLYCWALAVVFYHLKQ